MTTREPLLPPSRVSAGPSPGFYWWHNAEIAAWQGRVATLAATPWYALQPWPQVIASAVCAAPDTDLPRPVLVREAFAAAPGWGERYSRALEIAPPALPLPAAEEVKVAS